MQDEHGSRHVRVEQGLIPLVPVNIHDCRTPGINQADRSGNGAAKRHAELTRRLPIAGRHDVADTCGDLTALQHVMHKLAVGQPEGGAESRQSLPGLVGDPVAGELSRPARCEVRRGVHINDLLWPARLPYSRDIVFDELQHRRVHPGHFTVREDRGGRLVGVLNGVGDVAVAGEVLHQYGVLSFESPVAVTEDDRGHSVCTSPERCVNVGLGIAVRQVGKEARPERRGGSESTSRRPGFEA